MPLPNTVDGFPVVDSSEEILTTKKQLQGLWKENHLTVFTRAVRICRGIKLPPTDLSGHLAETESQFESLAKYGLLIPAHEWCLIPAERVQRHFSDRAMLVPGFALGVRVERIVEERKDLDDWQAIRDALANWASNNDQGIYLADTNTTQVTKGTTGAESGFWVHDIEPKLDVKPWFNI